MANSKELIYDNLEFFKEFHNDCQHFNIEYIIQKYSSLIIKVPSFKNTFRDKHLIKDYKDNSLSIRALSLKYNLTDRTVQNIIRDYKRGLYESVLSSKDIE